MILTTKHKIFLASLAYRPICMLRRISGKGPQGIFRRNRLLWELNLGEVIDFMLYLTGSFEPSLNAFIGKHLKQGGIAIDVGANIGAHTLGMAQAVGQLGQVHAIEATDYAYKKLERNIELNPEIAQQIHPHHCMLLAKTATSNETAPVDAIHSRWPFDTREHRHNKHQGVFKEIGDANKTTLDALIQDLGIERIDLIKIDVDGNELDVLKGGQATFTKYQPTIIMEVALDYHPAEAPKGFNNIYALLKSYGYRLHDLKGRPLPETTDGLKQIVPKGGSMNVLAKPFA